MEKRFYYWNYGYHFLSSGCGQIVPTFLFRIQTVFNITYFTLRSCILQHPKPRHPRSLCQRPISTELPNITALPHGSRYVNVTISTACLLTYEPSITNFSKISCVLWFTIIRATLINKLLTLTELNISQKKYTENLAESYQTVQHRYIITYIFLNMIK